MPFSTLQQLLGIELPIIQAPMAGVQGSALAIAVSNAGGLGSLPCAMLAPDAIRNELAAIKAQTTKPVNVNFFCHVPTRTECGARSALAGLTVAVLHGVRNRCEHDSGWGGTQPFHGGGRTSHQRIQARRGEFSFLLAFCRIAGPRENLGREVTVFGNHRRGSSLA